MLSELLLRSQKREGGRGEDFCSAGSASDSVILTPSLWITRNL